jgi:hypothetical protein
MVADRPGKFPNQSHVSENDASLLDSPTAPGGEVARHLPAGRPRSEITGRHDAGSGANETIDGLNSSEEALRRGAEDVPLGTEDKPIEDVPVFDRAGRLPRV